MDSSYWQQKACNERRQKLRREASKGNRDAAKKLLSSTLGALAKVISGEQLSEADKATIDYLRTGLHDHLIGGIDLQRALGLENETGGRPKITDAKKHEIFALCIKEESILRATGVSGPKGQAQKNIAAKLGMTPRTVRGICQDEAGKRLKKIEK